jgi:anti-sigma factor RsiW
MRERLPELLHGRLDGAAHGEVQAHLAGCDPCSAELALLRDARLVLQRAPAVDVARIVAALPRAGAPLALARGGSAASVRRLRGGWRPYAVAAGLLLAAGVSGGSWLQARAGGGAPIVVASATDVAADRDRLLAVNVEGLSDDDIAGLLDGLEDLDAVPASEPLPVVRVDGASDGGD